MNSLGEHILNTQNTDPSIHKLAAQKKIYSIAKALFYAQCLIATVIPVGIAAIKIAIPDGTINYEWVFIIYTIAASLSEIILDRIISHLKQTAASIQESFDCAVLNIGWNNVLVDSQPSPETIHKYYSKYIQKESTQTLY